MDIKGEDDKDSGEKKQAFSYALAVSLFKVSARLPTY
jgi:hypothetical protein